MFGEASQDVKMFKQAEGLTKGCSVPLIEEQVRDVGVYRGHSQPTLDLARRSCKGKIEQPLYQTTPHRRIPYARD
jgi:hypothetical protein